MSTSTPAGWYDDGHGALRWWDGARWTEHTHVAEAPAEPAAAPAASAVGEPGAAAETGTPAAGGPAKKSKLWILFVALGLVVVGMIVAAALIIPRVVGDLVESSQRDSSSWSAPDTPAQPGDPDDTEIAPPGEPVTGAEAEAVAAVVTAYDAAWNTGDCEAYHATLSEEMLEFGGWTCDEFAVESQFFVDSLDEYEITIVSTTRDGEDILVSTVETYLQVTDVDGVPLDAPQPGTVLYDYTLTEVDGVWVIDDITEL